MGSLEGPAGQGSGGTTGDAPSGRAGRSHSSRALTMSDDDAWRLPPTRHGRDIRLGRDRAAPPLPSGAKARPGGAAAKTPEAVVKLTGRARGGAGHLLAQFDYITRTGTLPAETHDGERITERARLLALHDDWLLANAADGRGRDAANAAQSVALTLSMPPGTPPDRVEAAARRWAHDTFAGSHDWVMVRHDDTGHPHVHLAVRAVGVDGRRLAPGPADLQHWRERFALELRRLGVEAEATPRVARIRLRHADPPTAHEARQHGVESHAADTGANAPVADESCDRRGRRGLATILRNTQDGERDPASRFPSPSGDTHRLGGPEPTRFRPRGRG
ncbi:relaxase/mobilization nuclease domain-containing protein [Azospirillum sp. B21]|nr:relaxase/mobilization nuclease domain-containing protein [Azospirillum sp. B21]